MLGFGSPEQASDLEPFVSKMLAFITETFRTIHDFLLVFSDLKEPALRTYKDECSNVGVSFCSHSKKLTIQRKTEVKGKFINV